MSKRAHKASSAIVSPVNYPGWDTGRVYSDNSPSYAPIGGYPRSPLNHLPSPSPGREMRSPSEQPPLRYSRTSPSFTPIGSYVYPSAPLNLSDEDEPPRKASFRPSLRHVSASPSEQPPRRVYSNTSPSFTPIGSYVYPTSPLNLSDEDEPPRKASFRPKLRNVATG